MTSCTPFARALPTFIENWPEAWLSYAPDSMSTTLTFNEMRALGAAQSVWGAWFGGLDHSQLDRVRYKIRHLFATHQADGMLRLGSRSGKDADLAIATGLRATSPERGFALLTDGSKRLAWDLRDALAHNYQSHLYLRAWIDFEPWAEIRIFIRQHRCIGASASAFHPIAAGAAQRMATAVSAMAKVLLSTANIPSFVAEVAFLRNRTEPRLIDINPFHPLTDAGLFTWDWGKKARGDFDGCFRFRCHENLKSVPL